MNLGKYYMTKSKWKFSLERLVIGKITTEWNTGERQRDITTLHNTNLWRFSPSNCCWVCWSLSETSLIWVTSNVFVFMNILYCSYSASVKYCSSRLVTALPLLSMLHFSIFASSSCSKSFSLLFFIFSWKPRVIWWNWMKHNVWPHCPGYLLRRQSALSEQLPFLSHLFIFIPIFLEIDQTNFRASQPWWKTQ